MEATNIGERIAFLRKSRGLTQKQLAEMLGVSDKAVSRWERSESAPDLSLIPMIADLFCISCDDLLRSESSAAPEKPRETNPVSAVTPANLQIYKVISYWIAALGLVVCLGCYLGLGYRFAVLGFCLELVFCISAAICLTVGILKASEEITIRKEAAVNLTILILCLLSVSALTMNSSLDLAEVLLLGIPLASVILLVGLLLKWFLIVPTSNEKLHSFRSSTASTLTIILIITLVLCPALCIGFNGITALILCLILAPLEIFAALIIYRHDTKELRKH